MQSHDVSARPEFGKAGEALPSSLTRRGRPLPAAPSSATAIAATRLPTHAAARFAHYRATTAQKRIPHLRTRQPILPRPAPAEIRESGKKSNALLHPPPQLCRHRHLSPPLNYGRSHSGRASASIRHQAASHPTDLCIRRVFMKRISCISARIALTHMR